VALLFNHDDSGEGVLEIRLAAQEIDVDSGRRDDSGAGRASDSAIA
jgi:hypothetical protein